MQEPRKKSSTAFKRHCKPSAIGDMVEKLCAPSFKKRGFAEVRILSDWPQLIGDALSHVTRPEKLSFPRDSQSGGILTVKVEPGWATEVQHLSPQILDRIATYFGYRAVSGLRIIQAPLKD